MRRLINAADFTGAGAEAPAAALYRLAPTAQPIARAGDEIFSGIFSNEFVGRDNHVVVNAGIDVDNFLVNRVMPWGHDDQDPPVARATGITIGPPGGDCTVSFQFVPTDISPFAGMIRALVDGGWVRGLSMSWRPLKYKFSTDRDRPGGLDFLAVDVLEISIVPIPALPDALIDARARGVNTAPMAEWAERTLDRGPLIPMGRPLLEELRRSALMPYQPSRGSAARRTRARAIMADVLRTERRDALAPLTPARREKMLKAHGFWPCLWAPEGFDETARRAYEPTSTEQGLGYRPSGDDADVDSAAGASAAFLDLGDPDASPTSPGAASHVARAAKHLRTARAGVTRAVGHADDLRDAIARTAAVLDDSGLDATRIARCVNALTRASDGLRTAHGDIADAHASAGEALAKAGRALGDG